MTFNSWLPSFDAGGDGQRAPVQRVHAVGVDEAGQVRRAANAADGHDLMRLEAEFEQRGLQRGQHGEIPAARTPVRMDLALVGVLVERGGGRRRVRFRRLVLMIFTG